MNPRLALVFLAALLALPAFAQGEEPDEPLGIGATPLRYGARQGGRKHLAAAHGRALDKALVRALKWLALHQSPTGEWDPQKFTQECGEVGLGKCDGAGTSKDRIASTALALLAFQGEGTSHISGTYKDNVALGIRFLRSQQNPDSGQFGGEEGESSLRGHALATLALSEAFGMDRSPLLKGTCNKAVKFCLAAQSKDGGWHATTAQLEQGDTRLTAWMIQGLEAAKDAGLEVDPEALKRAAAWVDKVADKSTRPGATLLARFALGQPDADALPILQKEGDALLMAKPKWNDKGNDFEAWYFGTYAMYQLAGASWRKWETSIKEILVEHQSKRHDQRGSWDPLGPWGLAAGRVDATALMALNIEVFFRYSRPMR